MRRARNATVEGAGTNPGCFRARTALLFKPLDKPGWLFPHCRPHVADKWQVEETEARAGLGATQLTWI